MKHRIDYSRQPLTVWQQLWYVSLGEGIAVLLAYLFYEHWSAVLLLSLLVPFYLKTVMIRKKKERIDSLNRAFLDALEAMVCAMQAGYSPENALRSACENLEALYRADSDIVREFREMEKRLAMGETLESLLRELGERSGAADIRDFAEIYTIAGRSGGRLIQVMERTCGMMREKRETELALQAMLSARKLEQTIMSLMPVCILLYLKLLSPGFLSVLYHNVTGVLLMSSCLTLYGAAWLLGKKMMEVEL